MNQELNSVMQRLVYRLTRRLDLTRFDLIGSLVVGGLVDLTIIVIGRLVVVVLLFVRGLVSGLVGGSFVNRSRSS
jgi:hypothetical protein